MAGVEGLAEGEGGEMKRQQAADLARKLAELLADEPAANDETITEEDERELRERARAAAERMRRARNG